MECFISRNSKMKKYFFVSLFLTILFLTTGVNADGNFIGTGYVDKDPYYNLRYIKIADGSFATECTDKNNNDDSLKYRYDDARTWEDMVCVHALDNTERCRYIDGFSGAKYSGGYFLDEPLLVKDFYCDLVMIEENEANSLPIYYQIEGKLISRNYLDISKSGGEKIALIDDDKNLQFILTDNSLEDGRDVSKGVDLLVPQYSLSIENPNLVVFPEGDRNEEYFRTNFLQTTYGGFKYSPVKLYIDFDDTIRWNQLDGRLDDTTSSFILYELNRIFEPYNIQILQGTGLDERSTVLTYKDKQGDVDIDGRSYWKFGTLENYRGEDIETDPWNNRINADFAEVWVYSFDDVSELYETKDDLIKELAYAGAHQVGHSLGLEDVKDFENIMDYSMHYRRRYG